MENQVTKTLQEHLDLVDETVKYYSEDTNRRSVTGGRYGCSYESKNQKDEIVRCAVGRCLVNPKTMDSLLNDIEDANEGVGGTAVGKILEHFGEEAFRPEYRGFNPRVWRLLQSLHDRDAAWDDKGITKTGESDVSDLKATLKLHIK